MEADGISRHTGHGMARRIGLTASHSAEGHFCLLGTLVRPTLLMADPTAVVGRVGVVVVRRCTGVRRLQWARGVADGSGWTGAHAGGESKWEIMLAVVLTVDRPSSRCATSSTFGMLRVRMRIRRRERTSPCQGASSS